MKELFKEIFSSPIHLGVALMVSVIMLFLLSMLFSISLIPTWLWLILTLPGFSMVIAEREPDSFVGEIGLFLYNKMNIYGKGSYVPKDTEETTIDGNSADEADTSKEWDKEMLEEEEVKVAEEIK